jgi:hypothetical protein
MYVLANWLYQEGVCEPDEFLGRGFARFRKIALRSVSLADLRQAFIIRTWLPYFDLLLQARKSGCDLSQLGFEQTAILASSRRCKPIAAACEWLAIGLGVDATALANAYSRIFGGMNPSRH